MNRSPSLLRALVALAAPPLMLGASSEPPAHASPSPGYEYISPVPGSSLVSRYNNIILRPGPPMDEAALRSFPVSVMGATSGAHPGRLELSDDRRTVIFLPDDPYTPGEEVSVTVGRFPGGPDDDPVSLEAGTDLPTTARADDGHGLRNLRFSFFVSPLVTGPSATDVTESLASEWSVPGTGTLADSTEIGLPGASSGDRLDYGTLPSGYPTTVLLTSNRPGPGYTYLTPFTRLVSDPGHLVILDRDAKPVFYRRLLRPATDFKVLDDGRIVYFTRETRSNPVPQYYVLDRSGATVDSFATGNGYATDAHDLKLLPNGHVLLMAYDSQPVRMDLVVPGGRAGARVVGLVVQELDLARRVVFQWRSWDHFQITDTRSPLATLTEVVVDYVHGNSLDADPNGDVILSSRHLNEITKISRRTGEVLWRMGPHALHNEFSFLDDAEGFSHQHDVRLLPNGHLTLFDNGNYKHPERSRVVEYEFDEVTRTARLVWEYRRSPSIYGSFLGSLQQLTEGGSLIDWGGVVGSPKVTEIHVDGTTAWEVGFVNPAMWTYRAFRGPWRTTRITVDRTTIGFHQVDAEEEEREVIVTNPGPDPITLNYFTTAGSSAFSIPLDHDVTLDVGESAAIPIRFTPESYGSVEGRAYIGAVRGTDVFAQDIDLEGEVIPGFRTLPAALRESRSEGSASSPAATRLDPIGPGAQIRFALERPGRARLEIFTVQGRRVAVPLDAERSAGPQSVAWRPEDLAAGVYFCRLTAPGRVLVRRFAHLR